MEAGSFIYISGHSIVVVVVIVVDDVDDVVGVVEDNGVTGEDSKSEGDVSNPSLFVVVSAPLVEFFLISSNLFFINSFRRYLFNEFFPGKFD